MIINDLYDCNPHINDYNYNNANNEDEEGKEYNNNNNGY
jgi:hypothetical protein